MSIFVLLIVTEGKERKFYLILMRLHSSGEGINDSGLKHYWYCVWYFKPINWTGKVKRCWHVKLVLNVPCSTQDFPQTSPLEQPWEDKTILEIWNNEQVSELRDYPKDIKFLLDNHY